MEICIAAGTRTPLGNYGGSLKGVELTEMAGHAARACVARSGVAPEDAVLTSPHFLHMNLLGSHDTPRVRTIAGGDADAVRFALSLLFAFPGAPMLFAGDEVGLLGGRDPGMRVGYPWPDDAHSGPDATSKWDAATLDHVRSLAALRRDVEALQRGGFRRLPVVSKDKDVVYAFSRMLESVDGTAVVVANAGTAAAEGVAIELSAQASGAVVRWPPTGGDATVAESGTTLHVGRVEPRATVVVVLSGS